jgi:hypothetical protein
LEIEKDHQVTTAAILSIASKYAILIWNFLKGPLTDFLKENWKQISYIALLAWAVMCLLTHCAGVIDPWGVHGGNAPDTASVRVDTAWVYPDTTAIFALHGFDTIPRHIERLNDSIRRIQSRFRPRPADHSTDDTCADSLATLRNHSEVLTSILDECDEAYHDAIALRTYGDTLRNDSIEVTVNFRVEGRLKGVPSIRYRYLAPYPVITNTVTVNAPVRRQVYIDGGVGPRLTFENVPNAIEGSLGLGFVNRNNLSLGIEAGVSHADYRVGVRVRKGFSVGK